MNPPRKVHRNVLLSILLLAGMSFSVVSILRAVAPDPGHNFSESSGGVIQGNILYGSAADVLTALPKDTNATRYLSNTGTTNNPAWAQVDLADGVTGALVYGNIAAFVGLGDCDNATTSKLLWDISTGVLSCGTDQGAVASGWTDDGTTVRLTDIANNVGIGTADVSEKLELVGNASVSGTGYFGGKVGIGTTAPGGKFEVSYNGSVVALGLNVINTQTSGTGAGAGIAGYSDDGAALANGDRLGWFLMGGTYDGTHTLSRTAGMAAFATENWSSTNKGTQLTFDGTPTGSATRATWMRLIDGNVGIGTVNVSEKLELVGNASISGTIRLPLTTANTTGVIYKGATPFIHDFTLAGTEGENIFIGLNSGNFTMTGASSGQGSYNNAVGSYTLTLNTIGYFNNALGTGALHSNTTGIRNSAVGGHASYNNTTGSENVALGHNALIANTAGSYNTAIGADALLDLNATSAGTGSNTALGYNAGRGITTGVNNTIIGANISGLATGLSNTVILADGAGNQRLYINSSGNAGIGTTNVSEKLELVGNASVSGNGYFLGNVGVGINNPSVKLHVRIPTGSSTSTTFSKIQTTDDTGQLISFTGGTAGTTVRGYFGYTKSGTGTVFLWANEIANYMGLLGIDGVHIGTTQSTPEITVVGGKVGIGETVPGAQMEIKGPADNSWGQLRLQSTTNNTGLSFYTPNAGDDSSARNWQIQNNYAAYGGLSIMRSTTNTGAPTTSVMEFDGNGNIGIGVTIPGTKLHVSGGNNGVLGAGTDGAIRIVDTYAGTPEIQFGFTDTTKFAAIGSVITDGTSNTRGDIVFGTRNLPSDADLTERMRIDGGGNVGIGTTNLTQKLEVNGIASISDKLYLPGIATATGNDLCINATTKEVTNAGGTSCGLSSIRFKENVKPLPIGALDKIMQLQAVSFNFKPELDSSFSNSEKKVPHIGLIAEEMEKVEPRLVFYESDGTTPRGIAYEEYTALLTKAIQELDSKNKALTARLDDLEQRMAVLDGKQPAVVAIVSVSATPSPVEPSAPSSSSGPSTTEPVATEPVITLTGEETVNLNIGDVYAEQGATATDDSDISVVVEIAGSVDTAATGSYTIRYNATDSDGNAAAEVTRTVTVGGAAPSLPETGLLPLVKRSPWNIVIPLSILAMLVASLASVLRKHSGTSEKPRAKSKR